jgi:hypothetical protein
MKKRFVPLLLLAALLDASGRRKPDRFATIYVQDKPLHAEIAATPEARALGLMFRRHLNEDYGMLFVFPVEEIQSFWMKNTLIPLDMIFINGEQLIVDLVHSAQPCAADPCPSYVSACPARYVLEVAGGLARRLNLQVGDRIFIPPID